MAARAIDEPEERRTATLLALVDRQFTRTSDLTVAVAGAPVAPGPVETVGEIEILAGRLGSWQMGLQAIREVPEPLASIVDQHLDEGDVARLTAAAEVALGIGEPADIQPVLVTDVGLADLEAALVAHRESTTRKAAAHAADEDRRAWLLGGAALFGARARVGPFRRRSGAVFLVP